MLADIKQLTFPKNENIQPNPHLNEGRKLRDRGEIEQAIIAYICALETDGSNFIIHKEIGEILHQKKEYAAAVICHQKAISLNPNSSWCYNNLGNSFLKLGNQKEAIVSYQKSIELNEDFFGTYLKLGEIFANKNELELAIHYYRQAIKKNQQSIDAHLALGDCLTKKEYSQKAISHYRTAIYQKTIDFYPQLQDFYQEPSSISQPNFLIIGTPKGGTTSLYSYLIKHPQVIPCLKKEIHFWPWRYHLGLDWYLAHFPRIPERANYITGEATTDFFDRYGVAREVRDSFPNVKTIALLRNPIDRAISQYYHWVRLGWETRTLEEVINADLQLIRQNPDNPVTDKISWKNYLLRGIYIKFIREWRTVFPQEQLLILKSEDFYNDPQKTLGLVFDYLGLAQHELLEYKKYNAGSYPQLDPKIYQELRDLFEPYNHQLYQEIGIDFQW